jgi:hypothetical protein
MLILLVICSAVFGICCPAFAQQAGDNTMSRGENTTSKNVSTGDLEKQKLKLEIQELERKSRLGIFDRPLGQALIIGSSTLLAAVLTLSIGGYLLTRLGERRAKSSKNLEEAIKFVDEVGKDINSALTTMFQYIRHGNFKGRNISQTEKHKIDEDREKLFSQLQEKVPTLFAKRLSVKIRSDAFLGSSDFYDGYDALIQEIEQILNLLGRIRSSTPLSSDTVRGYISEANRKKDRSACELPSKPEYTYRNLEQPFKELNDWTEVVWARTVYLLASALKKLL